MTPKTFYVATKRLRPNGGCPNKNVALPELKELMKNEVVLEETQPIATKLRVQTPSHFTAFSGFVSAQFLLGRNSGFIRFNTRDADMFRSITVVIIENVVHGTGKINGRDTAAADELTFLALSQHTDCSDNIAHEARVQLHRRDENTHFLKSKEAYRWIRSQGLRLGLLVQRQAVFL